MKFRKKPVLIDAIQWTGDDDAPKPAWLADSTTVATMMDDTLSIDTLEGTMTVIDANPTTGAF